MKIRIFLIGLVWFCMEAGAFAQLPVSYDSLSDNVLYRKEWCGGLIFHSGGWGVEFRWGRNKTAFDKRLFEVDIIGMKSNKEIKSVNPYFSNSRPYFYGKLNSMYIIRGGYTVHHQLNRKPYWGGVELRYFYGGGVSLGISKPIYLYIVDSVFYNGYYYEFTTKTERYDPQKHDLDNIYGRASFLRGFDKAKFFPGIYLKGGLNFDFGNYYRTIKCLEVGAALDIYPQAIKIMAFNRPKNFFPSVYINLNFGHRYN